MLKPAPLCLALLSLLPALADAHGPSRLKVDESIEIAAPADKVWAKISKFADPSWIPAVAKAEATGGNEPGATRHLTLKGDGSPTIDEELVSYDAAAMSYKYKIAKVDPKVFPVSNYASTLSVSASADGRGSKVDWKAGFYRGYPNNDPPPELNDDASQAAVTGLYQSALKALKTAVESGK
ncbi:MAG: SRPBCC family protein [Nevskia sp.]